jgi:putative SOS response-associated peptidase YedK
MCGRYRRTTSEEELARLYHIPIPNQTDCRILEPKLNTHPDIKNTGIQAWRSKLIFNT